MIAMTSGGTMPRLVICNRSTAARKLFTPVSRVDAPYARRLTSSSNRRIIQQGMPLRNGDTCTPGTVAT